MWSREKRLKRREAIANAARAAILDITTTKNTKVAKRPWQVAPQRFTGRLGDLGVLGG